MELLFVLGVGLAAGTISGVVGFGSSIMLMPVLVIVFGPLHAVPIMAIAAILANVSRVAVWWREVDWRACAAYSLTGVPAAALGARTLLALPPSLIEGALGVFFLLMIPVRRWLAARGVRIRWPHLVVLGAVIGFLTGIVATTGPITAPIFLAYGLVKGAFIATEAAGSLAVYLSKAVVFRRFGALPLPVIAQGLITGTSLMAGAWIAKRFVLRLHPDRFRLLMDALMLISGLSMLYTAFVGVSS
ncbi:MAG TPA: sulfite exporter TauE/SafE family protein [Gemmatimonadales bacterium]|nr:sulfite exporter TauE/SafE family protein [Gemmatimonadales bacterium]